MSFGRILTAAGVTVAVGGVIAMAIGLKLSADGFFQNVVMYKGIFAAAAGLMIVGALFGRREHQKKSESLQEAETRRLPTPALDQTPRSDVETVNIPRRNS